MSNESKALVLLSGGQDSATCLAWSLTRFAEVSAVCFDYGQRHRVELELARELAKEAGVSFEVLGFDLFSSLTRNSLTSLDMEIDTEDGELPNTFVPGRNLMFLTVAAIAAYQRGCRTLVTGVCQTDYSGYPDCREPFVEATQKAISLALDVPFTVETPLMHLTKAATVLMMKELGKLDWYARTHTCYEGLRPACGTCPACVLRLKGFEEAGISDPLDYQ